MPLDTEQMTIVLALWLIQDLALKQAKKAQEQCLPFFLDLEMFSLEEFATYSTWYLSQAQCDYILHNHY